MAYVPPHRRAAQAARAAADELRAARIAAATTHLANPSPTTTESWVAVPPEAWADRGYNGNRWIEWTGVAVPEHGIITIRCHVHYVWIPPGGVGVGGHWNKIAGNAWIRGVDHWQVPTPAAVVVAAPAAAPFAHP